MNEELKEFLIARKRSAEESIRSYTERGIPGNADDPEEDEDYYYQVAQLELVEEILRDYFNQE